MAASPPPLVLVKLGGSLLTDKTRPGVAHEAVIARLGAELAALAKRRDLRLIVGHGSGSFGHAEAARARIKDGLTSPRQRSGASATQARARELHTKVIDALLAAGAAPFSLAPSSFLTTRDGKVASLHLEPFIAALEAGFLPVTYGDVVMDHTRGVAIASTETVLLALARRLLKKGHAVRAALWLGTTAGVLDEAGATIPHLAARTTLGAHVSGAAGIDVTGGMRHRVASAQTLARLGVNSWILNGREPGVMAKALAGRRVLGTWVGGDRSVPRSPL